MSPEDEKEVQAIDPTKENSMTLEQMQAQRVPLTPEQEMDVAHLEANGVNEGQPPEITQEMVELRTTLDEGRNWAEKLGEEERRASGIYLHEKLRNKRFQNQPRGEGPFIPASDSAPSTEPQSEPKQ